MTTEPRNRSRDTGSALDGWIEGEVHIFPLRVQYEDTDAGGIIYHSNYVSFAERGRSACLRCLGIRQEDALAALQQGDSEAVMLVVRRVEVDFMMTAGLGAELRVETALLKLGGASMKLQQTIRHVGEGTKIEDGHILARLLVVELPHVLVPRKPRQRLHQRPADQLLALELLLRAHLRKMNWV